MAVEHVTGATSPKYPLRGHQLGYRPKTNAYDAWDVPIWDQYIRDLAMFGTNAVELIPPRSDDEPDSPHFPLSPERMMVEMSRICDEYGLDVWIWYPAMDPDYADPKTVESALKEWEHFYQILPRIDALFVPGGDPGHTEPRAMLAFLEKQKASLRRYHPKAQMWMSPQGFRRSLDERLLPHHRRPPYGNVARRLGFRASIPPQSSATASARTEELPDPLLSRHYAQRAMPIPGTRVGHCLRSYRRA